MSKLDAAETKELVVLYQKMADHTQPECASNCHLPYSCCSPEYCEFAMEYAQKQWGLVLLRTTHERLPLMGPKGCTAPPHVRPMCTYHTCDVNGFGFKRNDPGMVWTLEYFKIREAIDALEIKRQHGGEE